MALLEVRGLVKYYGRRRVVNGVSFDVNPGEVVGLLGPNGAGKTTSFRMTTGMISPYAGTVRFAGKDVTHWPMYQRARLGMGYLSQEASIFRKLTVEQNVLAVLEAIPQLRSLGRPPTRAERFDRTYQVLEQFGLLRLKNSLAQTLSGGERRRLEIARCLVCEPMLILLDEPFTGIDPITISDIQSIVRGLRDRGIGVLLTDHHVRETLKITDRSYVITDGTVEAHGTPDEIIRHPVVIAKYLGQDFVDEARGRSVGPQSVATPAAPPSPAAVPLPSVREALQQERILLAIEELKTERKVQAERELREIGASATPHLLDALERRDYEIRRMAYHVLQAMHDNVGEFDPCAPEAQRRLQIDALRGRFQRRAG
jgi:lipopolysaccharide export system ATP-binding protein